MPYLLSTLFLHLSSSMCMILRAFFNSLRAAFTAAPSCTWYTKQETGEVRGNASIMFYASINCAVHSTDCVGTPRLSSDRGCRVSPVEGSCVEDWPVISPRGLPLSSRTVHSDKTLLTTRTTQGWHGMQTLHTSVEIFGMTPCQKLSVQEGSAR